ncbi:meckelin [Bradysia coprophila]|uniref:meckelin n=1 Tax=Bradysia coprophila TaxID=38358 RepID=UPI00187DD40B|nr:meckelin [Bradysia coprophila]
MVCVNMKVILFILASLNGQLAAAEENKIFLYNRIEFCKANEYFDVNYFKCVPCDSNLNLIVADDYLTCSCNKNTTAIIEYDSSSKQPICQANKTQSTCSIKYIQQTHSNVQSKIVQIVKRDDQNCTCNTKLNFFFRYEYCIPKALLKDFTNYANLQPTIVYKDLNFITFFCQVMKDVRFCNHLANLCVLTNYNLDKNSPCSLFFTSQTSIISNGNDFKMTPLLFYKKGKDSIDEMDKVLDHHYSVNGNDVRNGIEMLLTAFHVNGTLKTIQRLAVSDLNFCDESTMDYTHIKFAKSFVKTCSVNLKHLIATHNEPLLYDLYLNYTENNLHLLKSVPVLIRNAFAHNAENNREKWQLVKRFFLLDTFTDRNSTFRKQTYNDRNELQRFKSFRYAKDVELIFTITTDHTTYPNRISVPLLKVNYGEVNITNLNGKSFSVYVDFRMQIKFVKNYDLNSMFDIVLSILLVTAFIYSLFRAYCYKTRQQRQYYDVDIFVKFLVYLCSYVGNALFAQGTFISIYALIVVRTQSIVKMLLPVKEQDVVEVFIHVAVALKTISIIHLIWEQSHIDIFLIDWERPKVFDHHPRNHLDTPSISSSSKQLSYDGVSAWRNYFIANEWLKLTTKRKFCFLLHIVIVLFTVVILNLEHRLFDECSMVNIETFDSHNKTLQIAWGIIIFTVVYLAQRLVNFLFHERYVNNSVQQFVDVCSMANVSLFILKHETFGYYIHGRSPHGFSDTDMCSMILQLKREEDNICGHRGLLPSSEQQTYSFQAPKNLRILYDKMIIPLHNLLKNGPESHHTLEVGHKLYEQSLEKIASVYYNINRFLGAFIDHGLKDLEYIVQEKSVIEKVLEFEFSNNGPDTRGVFYLDSGHSFDNVLFYGNDTVLFLYELMVFIWIFVLTDSYVAGILGVAGVQQVLQYVTHFGVKWNLSRKTLIDRRFLL